MLFVGDILQLQHVNCSPVFDMVSQKSLSVMLGCATSINIWRDSVVYDKLTIIMNVKRVTWIIAHCSTVSDVGVRQMRHLPPINRVIQVSVVEILIELKEAGRTPVYP